MNPRFALKKATDDVHGELDGLLSKLDLSDPADYAKFLSIQARVLPALECALDRFGMAAIVADWGEHRRASLLRDDLEALGERMPEPLEIPPMDSAAKALGAAYVMEGSRLGGQMLVKSVGPGMPNSFLFPNGHKGAWPALVAALNDNLGSAPLLDEAKDAAARTFGLFLEAAHISGLE